MTVPKRFGVLRFVAALMKVISWIVLILAILAGVVAAVSGSTTLLQPGTLSQLPWIGFLLSSLMATGTGGVVTAIVTGLLIALGGLIYFVIWYAAAEALSLNLAMEENTRLTAALLLRMHQESQPDARTAPTYGTTYASEPFEA